MAPQDKMGKVYLKNGSCVSDLIALVSMSAAEANSYKIAAFTFVDVGIWVDGCPATRYPAIQDVAKTGTKNTKHKKNLLFIGRIASSFCPCRSKIFVSLNPPNYCLRVQSNSHESVRHRSVKIHEGSMYTAIAGALSRECCPSGNRLFAKAPRYAAIMQKSALRYLDTDGNCRVPLRIPETKRVRLTIGKN